MSKCIEEKETYTIGNESYNVISVTKEDEDLESIYNIVTRYVLQKLEEKTI